MDGLVRPRPVLISTILTCAALTLLMAAPTLAAGAEQRSVPATRSAVTTFTVEGYDVDFTLPTAAKNGCLVCHGDADLVRLKDGAMVSFYVDPALVAASAHASVQCTGCHLDFAFTVPHKAASSDWREVAKSACKNCHQDQAIANGRGVHRIEPDEQVAEGETPKPLCGDCHGSHDILMLTDNPAGQAALHGRGRVVCGLCHEDYWDNYDDYYHGAAYKEGASDAPACWDCHGAHEVLPSDDKDSRVNERHLVETCSACHTGASEAYVTYAPFVHARDEYREEVFLAGIYDWLREAFAGVFGG